MWMLLTPSTTKPNELKLFSAMPYWTLSTLMGAQSFLGSQVEVCPEYLADIMGQLPNQVLSCGWLHQCFQCKVNGVTSLNIKDALGWAEYSHSKQKRSETEHAHLWSGMTTSRWVGSFIFWAICWAPDIMERQYEALPVQHQEICIKYEISSDVATSHMITLIRV